MGESNTALARAGVGDRPIWVTEAGAPCAPDLNPTGVAGQTQWLRTTLPSLLDAGAARVFWFQLHEDAWDTRGFGLLDSSLRARPAFAALASTAESELATR